MYNNKTQSIASIQLLQLRAICDVRYDSYVPTINSKLGNMRKDCSSVSLVVCWNSGTLFKYIAIIIITNYVFIGCMQPKWFVNQTNIITAVITI